MKGRKNQGFTLVEILIVVVIMAILAAAIVPQFTDSTTDAKASTATMNLRTLRSQVELYKFQHAGDPPSTLADLTVEDSDGYGPYLQFIPENPFNNLNTVAAAAANPPASADGATGWLYHAATGNVWLNDEDHLDK